MKAPLIFPALLLGLSADGQTDSAFSISGYAELYYSYEAARPEDHVRQGPFYCFKHHNEVDLDLGFVKMAYAKANVRGNLALMAGTYAQYNLSAEQEQLRSVYEANVGVRISKTKQLWVDAGIMPGHIGFESAIGKDCWTLTRSLVAENSPYFDTGAKLGYTTDNARWYAAVLLLNGWQRTARPVGNNGPNLGTQLLYTPDANTTFNWSTHIGNDRADTASRLRVFNDLYASSTFGAHLGLTAGLDIGLEEAAPGGSMNMWIGPVLIARYVLDPRNAWAVRAEYYQDRDGVILPTGTPHGFSTLGLSVNYERRVAANCLFRVEARTLDSRDPIFRNADDEPTTTDTFITASLSIAFP